MHIMDCVAENRHIVRSVAYRLRVSSWRGSDMVIGVITRPSIWYTDSSGYRMKRRLRQGDAEALLFKIVRIND